MCFVFNIQVGQFTSIDNLIYSKKTEKINAFLIKQKTIIKKIKKKKIIKKVKKYKSKPI